MAVNLQIFTLIVHYSIISSMNNAPRKTIKEVLAPPLTHLYLTIEFRKLSRDSLTKMNLYPKFEASCVIRRKNIFI